MKPPEWAPQTHLTSPGFQGGISLGATLDIRTKSAAVRRRALFSTTSLIVLGVILAGTPSRAAGTDWNGTTSTDWYTAGNWSAGVPTSATDANIDTISPNAAVVDAVGAQSYWLGVGRTGIGTLTIQNGGTVASNALGVSGNTPR